jgi:hypothetical protein
MVPVSLGSIMVPFRCAWERGRRPAW